MKVFRFIFCLLILGFGCNNSSQTLPSISNISQLRSAIKQRVSQGDTLTHSHDELLKILPKVSPPFDQTKDGGGNFQVEEISFSQASRDYFYADTSYSLIIKVADYAVDSSAFFYLFDRYKDILTTNNNSSEKDSINISNGFGWTWKSPSNDEVNYLEVGYQARYHISMQTNHPTGTKLLQDALSKINWKNLQKTDL